MSISEPGSAERFTSALEETHRQHLKAQDHITEMASELFQTHKHFIKSAQDTCMKKCKEDEMLFDTIEPFKKDLEQKNKSLQDKRSAISEVTSGLQQKQLQKEQILLKMEKVREEQAKRRDAIEAQNKANKKRLKNLQAARHMFQEHLGLEIRAITGNHQASTGEKLQFIFRNINRSDLTSAYIVTLGINAEGVYQVVSSDPPLERLQSLEQRLQESNNLAAFLSNTRREFQALAPH
ncbi:unnamed protein product [Knipowitschia caucasica]|uniref:Kinetochore protein SPC25 n=1 Tax=Knipowitschia caucasica TaxID=637954 RepID=A0AAV2K1Z4_KNICA